MRVLFVTEKFPYPLDTGGNVRTYHLLKGLASVHEVSLLVTGAEKIQKSHYLEVTSICKEVHVIHGRGRYGLSNGAALARSLIGGRSLLLERHYFPSARRWIATRLVGPKERSSGESSRLLGRWACDVVHFNHLDAALYRRAVPAGIHCVLDEHNVVANQIRSMVEREQSKVRRMILAREHRVLKRLEAEFCNSMSRCLVCSEVDARALMDLGVLAKVAVVPNGVDLRHFEPRRGDLPMDSLVMFFGTLDYEPCERGVWFFCTEILPLIHRQVPDLRFQVVGRNPSTRLRKLAAGDSRIELTGRVEDVRPYVRRARVCVVPLMSGSGTRLKILEAFALGTPVVSTTIGAEGICAISGEDMFIADTPAAFAISVLELLRRPELAERIRVSARKLVSEKYGWDAICQGLLREYHSLGEQPVVESAIAEEP